MPIARMLIGCVLALIFIGGCESGGRPRLGPDDSRLERGLPPDVRAVWVARFHYQRPDDIRTIMRNIRRLGLNTVLWQVRGNGTALYRSEIEPWSEEYGYADPGFDPLELAVREAHANGLRIEAWMNVMPGWRGPKPPPIPNQLYHTRPGWFLYDSQGRRQPLASGSAEPFYLILNPCLPQVREYIVGIAREIVTRYEVDGLHLDYVRYAWDTTPNARQLYPRDARTLAIYRTQTGLHPDDDPRAWDDWRANQLTRLVADIRGMLIRSRPHVTLTAATWADPRRGYQDFFQDSVNWLRSGLLDGAYPMAYAANLSDFEANINAYQQLAAPARIIPGIGVYKHTSTGQTAAQIARCRQWNSGFALFSYDSLHATAGDRKRSESTRVSENQKRQARRAALLGPAH